MARLFPIAGALAHMYIGCGGGACLFVLYKIDILLGSTSVANTPPGASVTRSSYQTYILSTVLVHNFPSPSFSARRLLVCDQSAT